MILAGKLGAYDNIGADGALHPARYVVAAIQVLDAVDTVDVHLGAATHIGHTAAAKDGAAHHGAHRGLVDDACGLLKV